MQVEPCAICASPFESARAPASREGQRTWSIAFDDKHGAAAKEATLGENRASDPEETTEYVLESTIVSNTAGSSASPESRGKDAAAKDPWVPRFGLTERFAHWWTMAMMATALLTGLGMGDDGGSGPLLTIHAGSMVLLMAGLVAALIIGNTRGLFGATFRLFSFGRRDAAWVLARLRLPFDRSHDPESAMFNTGQKLLASALGISITAVILTGVQSWSAGGEGGLHGTAVAATVVLLGAHLFMALVNPATRPALNGMVFGHVRRSWAAQHHSLWLKDLDR